MDNLTALQLANRADEVGEVYRLARPVRGDTADIMTQWSGRWAHLALRGHVQALYDLDGYTLRVYVPGTNERRDWWRANFAARARRRYGGKWHGGFLAVGDVVAEIALDYRDRYGAVEIYGHSMGGAGAICAAFRLLDEGVKVRRVVAYDPPRVCSDRRAVAYAREKLYSLDSWRVLVSGSVVGRVPPRLWGKGWDHAPPWRVIDMDGRGGYVDQERSWSSWAGCVLDNIGEHGIQLVRDHGIERIAQELREIAFS